MGAYSSLLSPIACASHSSGAPFWLHQRNQQIPHKTVAPSLFPDIVYHVCRIVCPSGPAGPIVQLTRPTYLLEAALRVRSLQCVHKDKAERGTSKQPVSKESRCGRSPTQEPLGIVRGASIGQVWTRHLAPAAPASQPSLPTQFHDCSCHADSVLQFFPSLLPEWGKSRAASTRFRAL